MLCVLPPAGFQLPFHWGGNVNTVLVGYELQGV